MTKSDETQNQANTIAVVPEPDRFFASAASVFEAAIEQAGGVIAPLSDQTGGVVWVSNKHHATLAEILERYPSISWVQLPFAGVEGFAPTIRDQDRDWRVWTSAKVAYSRPVAEHALALTLALLRVFPKRARARSWAHRPEGVSLYGLDVVIVGAGGIARELIRLLEPFGVRVTIVRRSTEPVEGADETVSTDRLGEVLGRADVVVLAAALTDQTRALLGREEFESMKSSAYLVNIARGGLVDTDALVDALRRGELAGAGLDVTDPEPLGEGHPLWTMDNVLITPHQADTPEMVIPLLAERIRANTAAFLGHGDFVGKVDPELGY